MMPTFKVNANASFIFPKEVIPVGVVTTSIEAVQDILRSISNQYNPWLAEKMWMPKHERQGSHFLPAIENSWNAPAHFPISQERLWVGSIKNIFFLAVRDSLWHSR